MPIADKVWEVAEGALTDEDTEIIWLAFGNPTRNTGRFRECFTRYKHRWVTKQVDSRTVDGTNKAQIAKWAEDYGEDSDFFRVRVRGMFPRASDLQLIPTDWVAEIPQRYQSRIDAETGRITSGFDLRQTARAKAEAAPWQVRESALRAAVAQSVTGRPVNVEALFDLADPAKRAAALQRLKEPVETVADPEGEVASYAAGETSDALDGTDLEGAERMLADEQALTDEMAAQAGIDLKPFMREADELAADAETYAAAYRAAALCKLRN